MKKLLLLLLFFLSIFINAQPPSNMPSYALCDGNNDGFETFDLSSQIPAILNGLNPATSIVSFHETLMNSQTGANPITAINSYVNITPQSQTIYIRVVDGGIDVYFTRMNLVINTATNAGIDGNITVCETSFTTIDLYSVITGEQSGGTWVRVTGTGGTFNSIVGTYTPIVGATPSTFIYTLTGLAPCSNDSSVATINIIAQPNAGTDGSIAVCDTSTTIVDLFSLITGEQSGGSWTRTSGTGGTFNAIAGTYTPETGATTSSFTYRLFGTLPCIDDSSVATVFVNPPANPATLQFCDLMELAIYNLSEADAQITGGVAGFTVTYHETLTDAQIGANPIANGGYIPIATPIQILYARVINPAIGCFSVTTLTLNTRNCGEACPAPINLVATNITPTSFTLNWTNTNGSIGYIFNRVALVPMGAPPSDIGSFIVAAPLNSYVLTGLLANNCYDVYVKKACSTSTSSQWSAPLNICMPNCIESGACPQALVLNAFLDSNNNGVKDTGEVNFNNGNFVYQVNDSGSNQYGTSNDGSYYIFDSNPSNSYDISFAVNAEFSAYYSSTVSHNNVTLPTGSGANYFYFPIANPVPHVDAQVNLWPSGQPRPGFTYSSIIYYQNNGSQTIPNGTLTFTKDPNISITSISQTGTTTTSTGFTYDFTNLAPFETRYINVGLTVPTIPTVSLGDLLTNTVTIQIANDINLTNNTSSISQTVVGSYDPNDKMESHGRKIVHSTFTSNDYLYYTIQFENTGSASAEFIRIEDALDSQLDENTFEMISASHNVDTKRVGTQLTWHFYNIDLPPTSSNPNGSHGFVSYKIKPKVGYAIGDVIPGAASIYFDYNPAIVTNTFTTEFVLALGNPTFNANTISLYPNPTTDMVTISNSNANAKIATVVIYEVSGKRIYTLNKNTLRDISVDVSNFAKGLYLVELTSEDNTQITKKIIIK